MRLKKNIQMRLQNNTCIKGNVFRYMIRFRTQKGVQKGRW